MVSWAAVLIGLAKHRNVIVVDCSVAAHQGTVTTSQLSPRDLSNSYN